MDQPDVYVDFLFEKGLLFILIKNNSDAPALEVRVDFDQEFSGVGGRVWISQLEIFKHLEYLAPRKEIKIFLDVASTYFSRIRLGEVVKGIGIPILSIREPTELELGLSWKSEQQEKFNKKIKHNLIIYKDLGFLSQVDQ